VRPQIEAGNHGRIMAIAIETGAFEVDDIPMVAVDQLYPSMVEYLHRIVVLLEQKNNPEDNLPQATPSSVYVLILLR
jgi:hypothetical protein